MRNRFKEAVGFNDTWFMIIGIPIIATLIDLIMFGKLIGTGQSALFGKCLFVSFSFTMVYWLAFREVYIYKTKRHKNEPLYRRWFFTILMILFVFFVLQYGLDLFFKPLLMKMPESKHLDFITKNVVSLTFTILVSALYEGFYLATQLNKSILEKEQLKQEQVKSELSGLKDQINPHFLFNSLNTLSSLVHDDASKADAFITKMASVYRYILDASKEETVLLRDELNFLQAYIFMVKERFGENIKYEQTIDESILNKKIIPLSLQITFENCIKHNIVSKDNPLHIHLKHDESKTRIIMSNNIQLIRLNEPSSNVGLANIEKRLKYFTEDKLEVIKNEKEFIVSIPLI
jgi:two-component system, LytTR family, sensor kinase